MFSLAQSNLLLDTPKGCLNVVINFFSDVPRSLTPENNPGGHGSLGLEEKRVVSGHDDR